MTRLDLLTMKDDVRTAKVVETEEPDALPEGHIRLKVEKFALTANTITYAVYGTSFGYWGFFPAEEPWGRVPTWGFGVIADSNHEGFGAGERFYGFFPMSSHVIMQPEPTSLGFKDAAPNRQGLPVAYNHYASTAKDPVYDAAHEDEQMILRPLFVTSFLAHDFLAASEMFGGQAVAITSASSKTGYALAFLLAELSKDIEVVGLTSARNVGFTEGLGCYDKVLSYDQIDAMGKVPTVLVDIAGSVKVRNAAAAHLGEGLVHAMALGDTHWQEDKKALDASSAEFFFAPKWLAKRAEDWTMEGYVSRLAEAWKQLADPLSAAMKVTKLSGPDALLETYLAHADGKADPKAGHVLVL